MTNQASASTNTKGSMNRLSKRSRESEVRKYNLDGNVMMEAQLVDIDFYPRMSEETLAFNATLRLMDGTQVCLFDCRNDGKGGCTDIRPQYDAQQPALIDRYRNALEKWNGYLSTQRDEKFYEIAEQMGWNVADVKDATKSAESEVNGMLADWCDKHNL